MYTREAIITRVMKGNEPPFLLLCPMRYLYILAFQAVTRVASNLDEVRGATLIFVPGRSICLRRHRLFTEGAIEGWYRDGKRHREDGPAAVYDPTHNSEGRIEVWCRNGKIHRVDGPATVFDPARNPEGRIEEWWRNGEVHREDGPAVVYDPTHNSEGRVETWFWGGVLYRKNGPVIVYDPSYNPKGRVGEWMIGMWQGTP